MDKALSMLGLAKKAGRLEAGEDAVGTAAERRQARLILLAADAAENTARRARSFADLGECLLAVVPATKRELGGAVGRAESAMVALTDVGFASAVTKKLAEADAERYGALSEKMELKAKRAQERKQARRRRSK